MRILLKTKVKGNYKKVMSLFDRDLFEALKPKAASMEIVEFTGSQKGDKVHIRFVKPIKADWISLITEDHIDDTQAYFIDKGDVLPFPLKDWMHKHIVQKHTEDESVIVDDISFSSGYKLLDLFIYPALYFGFYPRKAVYRKYFNKVFSA